MITVGTDPIQLPGLPAKVSRTLTNIGSNNLYYGNRNVSSSVYTGVITPGNSATVTGNYYVVSTGSGTELEDIANVDTGGSWATGVVSSGVTSIFGRAGAVVAASGDYTAAQVTGAAPLASPAFTGAPTAPTQTPLDNTTKLATTAYTDAAVAVGGGAPAGAAGGDLSGTYPNPGVAKLGGTAAALYALLASPAFTGNPTVPNQSAGDSSTKAANTAFVANAVSAAILGLQAHPNVQWATTAALPANVYASGPQTLTGAGVGALSIDGSTPTVGDRVLVKNEAAGANNGLYSVTVVGTGATLYVLTRVSDMNVGTEVPGAFVFVEEGTTNVNTGWFVASPGPFTLGTTAITWSQFTGAGDLIAGTGISISGNTVSVNTASIFTSPALTGVPTAVTNGAGTDNTIQIATDQFVQSAIAAAGGGAAVQLFSPGNLGATYTLALASQLNSQLVGTLNANCTITVTGLASGCQAVLLITQDGTGGRTLTISNGSTSLLVPVPTAPNAVVLITIYSPDGTNMYVQGPSNQAFVILATNAAWAIPLGANTLKITAVAGGGGGGGGGSAAATQLQTGGSGGGPGGTHFQVVQVGANTTLNVTVGAGGAGGAGGAAGGNAGVDGVNGVNTTVTGTGISLTAKGGNHGVKSTASSTTTAQVIIPWGTNSGSTTASGSGAGQGGVSGAAGGPPFNGSGGGGGGGGPATTTLGGGAGGSGGIDNSGAAGTSGASGTSAGVSGTNAVANGGGGGGGGGGGAAGTGAGGNGANGGSGLVIIEVVG